MLLFFSSSFWFSRCMSATLLLGSRVAGLWSLVFQMTGGENPIILHTFLHLSKLFQNIPTSDSESEASVFDGNPQICYRKSASESTEIQYCAFLSFQEWPLPLLSGRNSVYWRKHLTSEHHSTHKPVPVYWKHWKKKKKKNFTCKGALWNPLILIQMQKASPWNTTLTEATLLSIVSHHFSHRHIGTPCALYHVTNESLTKDHCPFRIFRVAFLHEYPWPCASPTDIRWRCAGFSNSTRHRQ